MRVGALLLGNDFQTFFFLENIQTLQSQIINRVQQVQSPFAVLDVENSCHVLAVIQEICDQLERFLEHFIQSEHEESSVRV